MVNKNIQMKKKNNNEWINLFPTTLFENVFTNDGKSLDNEIDRLDQTNTEFVENFNNEINRLDNKDQEISDLLDNTIDHFNSLSVDVKQFGAVGDGITDDTESIQNAVDSGFNVRFTEGEYYFKKIEITRSNLEISFDKNVLLKSDEIERNIWVTGEELTDNIFITQDVFQDTNEIEISSTEIGNFKRGDYIFMEQTSPTGDTEQDKRERYVKCLLQIKEIKNNKIITEEPIPHSFQIKNNAYFRKVKIVENVKIRGNNTKYSQMGRTDALDYIGANLTVGFEVSGFNLVNGSGAGVRVYRSNHFKISNIKRNNVTNPINGYNVAVESGSGYGLIENVIAIRTRHGVDIANGSHDITVRDVYCFGLGNDAGHGGIMGHGQNTRNVLIENCHLDNASIAMGNNTYAFDHEWIIRDCTIKNTRFGIIVNELSKNIIIDNVRIKNVASGLFVLSDYINIRNVTFENIGLHGINLHNTLNDTYIENISVLSDFTNDQTHQAVIFMAVGVSNVTINGIDTGNKNINNVVYLDGDNKNIIVKNVIHKKTSFVLRVKNGCEGIIFKDNISSGGINISSSQYGEEVTDVEISNNYFKRTDKTIGLSLNNITTNVVVHSNRGEWHVPPETETDPSRNFFYENNYLYTN